MKAQDLMLGDLVTFRDCDKEIVPIMIMGIPYDSAVYGRIDSDVALDEIGVEDLAGIPITPEILVKNGFYFGNTATEEDFCGAVGCGYPEKGWCFDEGAGEIKIIFPNKTDGGLIRLDDQSGDRHLELIFAKPIMIHELQHALRLCGIEKEIVL